MNKAPSYVILIIEFADCEQNSVRLVVLVGASIHTDNEIDVCGDEGASTLYLSSRLFN